MPTPPPRSATLPRVPRLTASGKRLGRPPRTGALVPAGVRAPEVQVSETDLELNAEAIEAFAEQVGGRRGFIDVLTVASTAPEVEMVVDLLLDPRYRRYSLRRLCVMAGLTLADLFVAYRRALLVKAHLQATHAIAAKLPAVVADVMTRALPQPCVCPACQGVSPGLDAAPCLTCAGTGQVLTEPDLDRQKLALDLGALTRKGGGGVTVTQTTAVAASASALSAPTAGALEQLQQAVGELLFSPGRRRNAGTPAPVVLTEEDVPLPFEAPPVELPEDEREPPDELNQQEEPL